MLILRVISNSLAPLTAVASVGAYFHPPLFLYLKDWFLWFFAATMFALGVVLRPAEFTDTLKRPKAIMLGLATQYTVMPGLGFLAAYLSSFDPVLHEDSGPTMLGK